MKNRYKISELAKIFNISRQALIFYHKKNIFIPQEIDRENGYRYYSKNQIWDLMLILTLKKAGFSLEEIKSFTELRTVKENIDFLENKMEEIDKRIDELKRVREKLERRVKNLKEYLIDKQEVIEFENKEDILWYSITMKEPKDETEMIKNYEKLGEIARENGVEDIKYINIIDVKNIKKFKMNEIIPVLKLGIIIPENKNFEGCERLKIGRCFTINHRDSYDFLVDTYKKIDEYIDEKGYKNLGYSIEFMKEVTISTDEGVGGILEIVIPVIKSEYSLSS